MPVFNARLPHLKNYPAATFMILHLELVISITHRSHFVTTIEIRQISIPQNKRHIKKALLQFPLMFHNCVITIGYLQTISFDPRISLAADILLFYSH